MAGICIVTDSSAVFPGIPPSGTTPIEIIPLIQDNQRHAVQPLINRQFCEPPNSIPIPTEEWFANYFRVLLQRYGGILGLFHSSSLSNCYQRANAAATACKGGKHISIVDTRTFGAGLGILAFMAKDLIKQNLTIREIDQTIRGSISNIFTLITTSDANHLYKNGYITYAQAIVNDMLGLMPIFSLEQNGLHPLDKVRSIRQIIEYYQGFISEFDFPQQIAFMFGTDPFSEEQKSLTEFAKQNFPDVCLSTSKSNDTNLFLFGPHITALFLIDEITSK